MSQDALCDIERDSHVMLKVSQLLTFQAVELEGAWPDLGRTTLTEGAPAAVRIRDGVVPAQHRLGFNLHDPGDEFTRDFPGSTQWLWSRLRFDRVKPVRDGWRDWLNDVDLWRSDITLQGRHRIGQHTAGQDNGGQGNGGYPVRSFHQAFHPSLGVETGQWIHRSHGVAVDPLHVPLLTIAKARSRGCLLNSCCSIWMATWLAPAIRSVAV